MNEKAGQTASPRDEDLEVSATDKLRDQDQSRRRQLLAAMRVDLLSAAEAMVGYSQMLRHAAADRPQEVVDDLNKLADVSNKLYQFVKENVDTDWPEIHTPQFHERLRKVRHDIGNRLNHVQGYYQLLLADEQEKYSGSLAADLERIQRFCKDCESKLIQYKETAGDVNSTSVFDAVEEDLTLHRPAAPLQVPVEAAHVLVVDDSDVTRDLMAKFLEREGHQVETASNGRDALDILEKEDFDLVLLDFIMPEMNGFQVLKSLKGQERLQHTPVIMISALDAVADMVPCIEMGADDYLTKPVDFSLLRARANSSLERKRLREREFGQFFTTELARHYVRHPERLKIGREADITVMFCDIRGFSRISERLGPSETVSWVSDIMATLSDCVIRHCGVLVDYIGDELMAMWGAPEPQTDHAALACNAALDMLAQLPSIDERWQKVVKEPTNIGIGLNSGIAQVGNTGSDRKFKYGPLGPTVNLASRVQGATKYLATRLLVTGTTMQQLSRRIHRRRLCKVRVVNIQEPVELYEILPPDRRPPPRLIKRYEQALEHCESKNLSDSASLLGKLLAEDPRDGAALLLMSRVVDALLNQPDQFDPVWELPGK